MLVWIISLGSFGFFFLNAQCLRYFSLLSGNVTSENMMGERTMNSYSILDLLEFLLGSSGSGLALGLMTAAVQIVPSDTDCWRLRSWPFVTNSEFSMPFGPNIQVPSDHWLSQCLLTPSSRQSGASLSPHALCRLWGIRNKKFISLVISLSCSVVL